MSDRLPNCLYCGAVLVRRPNEYPSLFLRRKCCDKRCATLYIAENRKDKRQPICGVYQIKNLTTGKVYIGSSSDIRKRWQNHHDLLRKGSHRSPYLQRAWNKYGSADFEFSIVETTDHETMLASEQYWIDFLHSADPARGYNLSPTAGNSQGVKASDETRLKLSASGKGKNAGSRSGLAKLTEDQVLVIKGRLIEGDTLQAIANDYGVCFQTIDWIRTGKSWSHVQVPGLLPDDLAASRRLKRLGANNGSAKLTEADVAEIKYRLAHGETGYALARVYGVSKSLIYAIKLGHIWTQVTPATPSRSMAP